MSIQSDITLRLAVIGSRSFSNEALMATWIGLCLGDERKTCVEIVSGGARGADRLARKYAEDEGIAYKEFPAEWEHYGRRAGMKRNQQIVKHADTVLAFWDVKSPGTKDTIEKAILMKKPVIVIPFGPGQEEQPQLF